VRKERQVEIFRQRFGRAVRHVHLTAPEDILRQRYEARLASESTHVGITPYNEMAEHPNEVSSRSLIRLADAVFDTSRMSSSEIVVKILSILEDGST
jgi:adenylosuccinate synthase